MSRTEKIHRENVYSAEILFKAISYESISLHLGRDVCDIRCHVHTTFR